MPTFNKQGTTRRGLFGAAAAATATAAMRGQTQAPPTRPNILLIIADQVRADALGSMGHNPMGLTPNLDGMARRGVQFRQAITNQPVCAPARASLFTGQYQEKHGLWHNGFGLRPDAVTLPGILRPAGYSTNYIGKWHLGANEHGPQGAGPVPRPERGGFLDLWEAANALEHTSHAYEGDLYDDAGKPIHFSGVYRADFLTERAVRFLKGRPRAPFFLTVSYLEAHQQNDSDQFVPPRDLADRFRNPFVPHDLRPLPGSWGSQLGDYYGCVHAVDRCVGRLLETLEKESLTRDTIVMFVSDHGNHFKTRNTEYKRSPHEGSIHVPLVVQGPGFDRRLEVPELVSLVDIMPTLLEAVGAPVPASVQGRSFLPLVSRRTEDWRNEVYIALSEYMTGRVLRTPEWTYAVGVPASGLKSVSQAASKQYVEYMLYDLQADPFQQVNLAGRVETQAISRQLRERLLVRIQEAGGELPEIAPAHFGYV